MFALYGQNKKVGGDMVDSDKMNLNVHSRELSMLSIASVAELQHILFLHGISVLTELAVPLGSTHAPPVGLAVSFEPSMGPKMEPSVAEFVTKQPGEDVWQILLALAVVCRLFFTLMVISSVHPDLNPVTAGLDREADSAYFVV
mmetsp:Transcript_45874/g.75037  ORF Transcript_45874/g.75037 Transcript_45874/m.75037 type:complete len:144 (+) Transcript_45874:281-712(+)